MFSDSKSSDWNIIGPLVRSTRSTEDNPCYGSEMNVFSYGTSAGSDPLIRIATHRNSEEMPSIIIAMTNTDPGSAEPGKSQDDKDCGVQHPSPFKVRCDPQPKSTGTGPDGKPICTCYHTEETNCEDPDNKSLICVSCTHNDPDHVYGSSTTRPGDCQKDMLGTIAIFALLGK